MCWTVVGVSNISRATAPDALTSEATDRKEACPFTSRACDSSQVALQKEPGFLGASARRRGSPRPTGDLPLFFRSRALQLAGRVFLARTSASLVRSRRSGLSVAETFRLLKQCSATVGAGATALLRVPLCVFGRRHVGPCYHEVASSLAAVDV